MDKLIESLIEELFSVCPRVAQGLGSFQPFPYIQWDFDGDGSEFRTNGGIVKHDVYSGTIDYFTEGDSNSVWVDMKDALNRVTAKYPGRFVWGKSSKQTERQSNPKQPVIDHLEWWFEMKV